MTQQLTKPTRRWKSCSILANIEGTKNWFSISAVFYRDNANSYLNESNAN